jgi:hypothetical protein
MILYFRKLKNRVAAQTSRDRKKARLDDLEAEVKALREKVYVIHVCFYRLGSSVAPLHRLYKFTFVFYCSLLQATALLLASRPHILL